MRRLTINEVKTTSIGILKYLDEFCKNHNITYFAISGTLLGTVRHCGFIPWDDDIDIMMLRDDYSRFIQMVDTFNNEYYSLLSFELNSFEFPYSKIVDKRTIVKRDDTVENNYMGVSIDLFVYDYIGDSKEEVDHVSKKTMLVRKLLRYSTYSNISSAKIKPISIQHTFYLLSKIIGTTKLREICKKKILKYRSEKYKRYCFNIGSIMWKQFPYLESSIFEGCTYLPFEDMMIPCPQNYDHLLTAFYGDYMKLPPEDKRIPHDAQAFLRDE